MLQVIKKDTSYLTMEIATTAHIQVLSGDIREQHKCFTHDNIGFGPNAKDELIRIVQEQQTKVKDWLKNSGINDCEKYNCIKSYLRIGTTKEVFDVIPNNAITEYAYGRKEGWHPIFLNEKTRDIEVEEYSYEIDTLTNYYPGDDDDDNLPF